MSRIFFNGNKIMKQSKGIKVIVLILTILTFGAKSLFSQSSGENATREFKLPGTVDNIVWAGYGDILLFQIKTLARIVVFDIITEKIIGEIPCDANDETFVTGTVDSIFLATKTKRVLQRWSIQPLVISTSLSIPQPGVIDGIVGGYASSLPILLMTNQGIQLFTPNPLKPLKTDGLPLEVRSSWCGALRMIASADGSLILGQDRYLINGSNNLLRIDGSKIIGKHKTTCIGALNPSADGSLLFSSTNGVYSMDFIRLEKERRHSTFPTVHPEYYFDVSSLSEGGPGKFSYALCKNKDRSVVLTFDNLPGVGVLDIQNSPWKQITFRERIIAHPAAKKIIILDESLAFLHILPLDVVKALDQKGVNYLYVDSHPISFASQGTKYEYPIKVVSKAGNVKYKLDSFPAGMTITPEGVIAWNSPSAPWEKVSVIVNIEDSSKKNIFHSFVIQMR
jgi:hypothetical protein